MSSTKEGSSAADRARSTICREFASMLQAGSSTIRTRIVHSDGEPSAAWFYAHYNDGWHKQPDGLIDLELVRAVHETLEMLASREHGDEWSVRQHASADYRDTDIHFHRDKLDQHPHESLETIVAGLLFRDSHDSKKDVRHSIRTPR